MVALAACSRPEAPPEPVRAVKLLTVATTHGGSSQVFAGEVRARVESRLGFRVGGKILKRQAEVGQKVRAGDVLAQLDPQDLRLAADAARAQVAAARTSSELARADFKRYTTLKEQNFISGAELERRESTLKSAEASLDQAMSQLSAQGNQAGYAALVADAPGVVTAVEAEPGQVVTAGTPVVRLAHDGVRDAVFSVPEDQVRDFPVGRAVTVRSWSDADLPINARVRETGAAADPVTRTFTVKVALEGAAPPLGSTVSITPVPDAVASAASRIRIPTSALRRDGDATTVWRLDEATMTVQPQPVVVGGIEGNDVLIASGLAPGMRVVAAGVHVLAPGQKVAIYEGNSPVAQAEQAQPAINKIANGSTGLVAPPTRAPRAASPVPSRAAVPAAPLAGTAPAAR